MYVIKSARIALQWAKWIWKDFFANEVSKAFWCAYWLESRRFAFGDILKRMSFNKDSIQINDVDFNSLEKDYMTCKINEDIQEYIYAMLPDETKHTWNQINRKKFNELTDEDKLFLIEIYKNVPELSTRKHLQIFPDKVKNETKNLFFFAEKLENEIKQNTTPVKINTDLRHIVELIVILQNDFIPVKLYNKDIHDKFTQHIYREHLSETELSLSDIDIWLKIDVTWNWEYNWKIRRISKEQIKEIIDNTLIPVLSKFTGYSENFKVFLSDMKKEIQKDNELIELQNEYSKKYAERLQLKSLWEKDPTNIEYTLKEAYDKYVNKSSSYLMQIKRQLDSELDKLQIRDLKMLEKINTMDIGDKKSLKLNRLK